MMAKLTGLISSLFNVALTCGVSFHQPQQLQCLHCKTENHVFYRTVTSIEGLQQHVGLPNLNYTQGLNKL